MDMVESTHFEAHQSDSICTAQFYKLKQFAGCRYTPIASSINVTKLHINFDSVFDFDSR